MLYLKGKYYSNPHPHSWFFKEHKIKPYSSRSIFNSKAHNLSNIYFIIIAVSIPNCNLTQSYPGDLGFI